MRWRCIGLALAAVCTLLGGMATAQTPTSLTYDRAYRHFLASRYSYRTLYSSVPGSGSVMAAPFVYQSQFIDPGFSRQRITPFGYERFDAYPAQGGMTLTPLGYSNYYVPGFGYGLYAPYGGGIIQYYYR